MKETATQKQLNFIEDLKKQAQDNNIKLDELSENPTIKEASIFIGKTLKALKNVKKDDDKKDNYKKDNQEKILKDELMQVIKINENESMQKFYNSLFSHFVRLSNNGILAIEKSRIQTKFCFGYGYCGISTDEDEKDASSMVDYSKNNQDYFINENLKELNKTIEELTTLQDEYKHPLIVLIYKHPAGYYSYSIVRKFDFEYNKNQYANFDFVATDEDIKNILNALQLERSDFQKRLNTYLKRYGLSKIDSWSYLVD